MNKNLKNALYASIMKHVSLNVKAAINESFEFESNPTGETLVEIINKEERVKKIVDHASVEDWKEVILKMKELINDSTIKAPQTITNVDALAKYFIANGMRKHQSEIRVMNDETAENIANYVIEMLEDDNDVKTPLSTLGETKKSAEKPAEKPAAKQNEGEAPKAAAKPAEKPAVKPAPKAANEARSFSQFKKMLREDRR